MFLTSCCVIVEPPRTISPATKLSIVDLTTPFMSTPLFVQNLSSSILMIASLTCFGILLYSITSLYSSDAISSIIFPSLSNIFEFSASSNNIDSGLMSGAPFAIFTKDRPNIPPITIAIIINTSSTSNIICRRLFEIFANIVSS